MGASYLGMKGQKGGYLSGDN